MMVRQSGHMGEIIASQYPDLNFGTDYDFFQEPLAHGQLHGSSDWLMAFNDSAAVKALVAYLSSERGGQMWAQVGFGNTPNKTAKNAYTDERLKKLALILANSTSFVPDIEEAVPEEFASSERQAVVNFINGADLDTELDKVAAVQKKVLGK